MNQARRYLFVTMEGGGNVPPVLGAARQLVERGHHVRVLTEPCLQPAVESIGAEHLAFTDTFVRTDRSEDLIRDWEARSPPAAVARTLENVILGPARQTAAAVARALDDAPADALVVDWLLPGAAAIGEARAIPTAMLMHCINMLPGPGRPGGPFPPASGPLDRLRDRLLWRMFRRLTDRHTASFNAVRAAHGLPPLATPLEQYQRADRVLVQTSPAFDFLADPEPENLVYVGPVLDEPDWTGATWQNPWPADDRRPLVVLSLSTTFQGQRDRLQAAITALGRLDVRGLATLGPAMADQPFDIPDNVIAVPSAPHGLVFPHAAAFITHCGHGSVMRALASGVPLVALPMGRDQDGIATRIRHHGLGLRPSPRPSAIARALQRVLSDPSFRTAAQRLSATLHDEVAADRLRTELEALACNTTHRAA